MDNSPRGGGYIWTYDMIFLVGAVLLCIAQLWLVDRTPDVFVDKTPLIIGGLFLLGTSTAIVNFGLNKLTGSDIDSNDDLDQDTGWLIGKLENVLIISFVYVSAYTGLSIIFAAKSFVRKQDTGSEDTTYYLSGTLLNFTYSL
ncbi:hypothetical protein [Halorubrum amylolyticum]|uniref:hypothetical protein n=1 Tax=Halorubrum amylolyticum TaxID=2508724 RepID=UPI00100885D8|nr:hypothetical protein [Halorubrum amylolyticum]